VQLRDRVVQFAHAPLEAAARGIPELQDVRPLLERAKFGIEFFGLGDVAEKHLLRLRDTTGLERFAEFARLLGRLARATDYRLLSTAQLKGQDDDVEAIARVNSVVNFIAENYREELSAQAIAERLQMSPSQFARFFRRATGNGFIDFVTRIRVNKACQLLMDTDLYVADICREVGFHNLANFNRRFLELKGLTPREFRRSAQERFKGA
jgi:transcriptional regulator GlxA family with amidase domain